MDQYSFSAGFPCIVNGDSDIAKLQAILKNLHLIVDRGYNRLEVESNLKVTIQLITSSNCHLSTFISFTFIPRLCNKLLTQLLNGLLS